MRSSFIRRASRLRGGAPWVGPTAPAGPAVDGKYFGARYFAGRYFAPRYFDGTTVVTTLDALQTLLATMAVGELKLLSNTSYNLKTGPGGLVSAGEASAVDGDLYYNRARWDAGHPGSYTFTNDLAVMNYIDGIFGDGTGDLSSIMLYSGVTYDTSRKLICMIAPGGHSNGGHTGGLYFDAIDGAQAILNGWGNGTGASKKEKWHALCDPMPLSAADVTSAGQYQHANWGGMADYLDGPTRGFRWPQPVVNAVLGPANTVGPYSMHTYSAHTYHPGVDQIWISGYTPGVLESDFSSVPGAAWVYDAATLAYTKITTVGGSDAPSFLAPPDGDTSVMFYAYHSGGSNWASVLTSAPYTLTLRSSQGTGNSFESDAAPMWVEDFATSGKYSILRMSTTAGKFNAHPDVWPLGTATSASLVPATGYSGVSRLFNGQSGYVYEPVSKLIYAFCDNGAGGGYAVKCQTIDMWQGQATVQATWVIAEVTMTGDTYGAAGVNFETRSGFDNKVINLGSTYGGFLIVTYPGQVHLFKYATV